MRREQECGTTKDALLLKSMILEAQFQTSVQGILIVDNLGKTILFNNRFCEIWNIPQEILNTKDDKKMLDFVSNQLADPEEFRNKVEALYQSKNEKSKDEIMFLDKRYFNRYSAPLINPKGEHCGRIWYFLEITDLKKANEELKKLNAEKDKFFSIIAHDLRGPMGNFLGYTELMVEDLASLSTKEIEDFALMMRNSAVKLFGLLENLLEWSKMKQGMIPFDPISFPLVFKIKKMIEPLADLVKKKNLEISFSIPVNLEVFGDIHMIETVIRNLVSNAIKFTHPGGKINISANKLGENFMEIHIKDTGIGMNPELASRIFLFDKQARRQGTEGESSTGLGLVICKDFIERHGGEISVDSEEGKGSDFFFSLPIKPN